MTADERKQQILALLSKNGSVKVAELGRLFSVSEVTVRNDLADMESKGLLSRTHGGAVSSYKPYCSMNFNQRLETNYSEKMKIAEKISEMIEPNDTIMINAGTTTLMAFHRLPAEYPLKIITNSIAIALEASMNPNFNITLVGGAVNAKYQFTYGTETVEQLEKYHVDKLILSVDGIDITGGFSTYYGEEASADKAMISRCDLCIIAADRTKLHRNAFVKVADIDSADHIVTTGSFDDDEQRYLREQGVNVIFAE